MKGYQLIFFTEQDRRHRHTPLADWLLKFLGEHGAVGATLIGGTEGIDRAGHLHSAHFFELADAPQMILASLDETSCQRLLDALAQEPIDVAYVKTPVEFGRIGKGAK